VRAAKPAPPRIRTPEGRVLGTISDMLQVAAAPPPHLHPGTRLKGNLDVLACSAAHGRPGFDAQASVEYRPTPDGFRDDESPLHKPDGELRILALGDSFPFGAGVQLQDTWVQLLEQGLAGLRGGPVQVINGGFAAGYEPRFYPAWVESDGLPFEP